MTNRLIPLDEPYAPEIAAALEKYPQVDGYLLTLFRTFANSHRFLTKGVPNLLDAESPLSLREREIVILRTTANRNCEYEWGVHVTVFGSPAGFSDEQIAATRTEKWASGSGVWSDQELVLLNAVDELCAEGTLSDELLSRFQETFKVEQQLEICALVGTYTTISLVANVARLENEPFGVPFPT